MYYTIFGPFNQIRIVCLVWHQPSFPLLIHWIFGSYQRYSHSSHIWQQLPAIYLGVFGSHACVPYHQRENSSFSLLPQGRLVILLNYIETQAILLPFESNHLFYYLILQLRRFRR